MLRVAPFDFARDWAQYCSLYHRLHGHPVDQAYVNWRFLENPAGQEFGFGDWDSSKLVGFAGMEPRKI